MPFRDLREYLKLLERENEVLHIEEEVDWDIEVGAITKKIFDLRGPAPFFEKIRGYPEELKIVSGLLGPSYPILARYALAMEMPRDTTMQELMEEFIKRQKEPIPPRIARNAYCKENVESEEEVNILKFPFPIIHPGDGGRYIAWHVNITKDPETGWVNWGTYRMMIHNSKTTAISFGPDRHIKVHLEKYRALGKNMPMATAIGTDPICSIAAGTSIRSQLNEVDLAGGLRKSPVELVKCETIDIEVPSTAEIILEGEVSINETREEGPFGEYHGYMGEKTISPVYKVKCITHRDDPIVTTSNMSTPIHDSAILSSISSPASVLSLLREHGYPVKAISTLFLPNLYVISCKRTHTHMAQHIAYTIWGASRGRVCTHLIVVGDDIDVNDPYQVLWAFCTRVDPGRDILVAPHVSFSQLTPFPKDDVEKGIGNFVCYDADFPSYWSDNWKKKPLSFEVGYPRDIQYKVSQMVERLLKRKKAKKAKKVFECNKLEES